MTVQTTAARISYAGNDLTTVFSFPYRFLADSHLKVFLVDADGNPTTQSLTTHYTVSGAGDDSGGSVTMLTAPATGETLTIIRDPVDDQQTDYASNDAFAAETHETALDLRTMNSQRLRDMIGRCLRLSDGDPVVNADLELGTKASRLGKFLYFNATTGAPEMADIITTAISQSIIGSLLYRQTAAEASASVTPTNYYHEPGDVRRYGAVPDGVTDASTAFQNAINACRNTGVTVLIKGGNYRINSQLSVTTSSGTPTRLNFWQDRNSKILSYVTGSISGYSVAGFAILFDGWKESQWVGYNLDFANGTAGAVLRCRNQSTVFNSFISPMVRGGTVVGDRTTRTKVSFRFIGNESASGDTGYVTYWNNFVAGYCDIAAKHMECVVGDGDAATRQPNGQKLIAMQYERYLVAFDMDDTDEHFISGAWHSNAATISVGNASSLTQAAGVATLTLAGHGLSTDDIVYITGANQSAYNGVARITVTGTDTFTYAKTNGVAIPGGTVSPATGTIAVTQLSVCYQGNTTYSQIAANNESGGIGYFIEDGGSGGNIIQVIDNIAGSTSIVEDLTEENSIIDRQFYGASGEWNARIGTADILSLTSSAATLTEPLQVPSVATAKEDVASATDITFSRESQIYRITGTTTINTITAPALGSPVIHLIFTASLTVNDEATSSGNIRLAGAADFSATADDVLTLVWNSTDSKWHEVSRSVN